jgi:hypothetical protein
MTTTTTAFDQFDSSSSIWSNAFEEDIVSLPIGVPKCGRCLGNLITVFAYRMNTIISAGPTRLNCFKGSVLACAHQGRATGMEILSSSADCAFNAYWVCRGRFGLSRSTTASIIATTNIYPISLTLSHTSYGIRYVVREIEIAR